MTTTLASPKRSIMQVSVVVADHITCLILQLA